MPQVGQFTVNARPLNDAVGIACGLPMSGEIERTHDIKSVPEGHKQCGLGRSVKRRELERALESVPDFQRPDPSFEQYRTPAPVAADLLWAAWTDGDIEGKAVLDLGCGTGILAKGAQLLGASTIIGVDRDPDAIQEATRQVPSGRFLAADVGELEPEPVDTVIMNPPFGAQKGNRNADRAFYETALATGAAAIWFLAPTVSEKFLKAFARDGGMELEKVLEWDYPLPATMEHHQEAVRTIRVGGYRLAQ